MHPFQVDLQHGRQCPVSGHRPPHLSPPPPTILFNILSQKQHNNNNGSSSHNRNFSTSSEDSSQSWCHHRSQRHRLQQQQLLQQQLNNCHCEQQHLQTACRLKDPEVVCQAACAVLVKTICFTTSLPAFCQLPQRDQLALLQNSWVPLFILGLAQEHTEFEVTETRPSPPSSANSILKRILLSNDDGTERGQGGTGGGLERETSTPTLAMVHRLKASIQRLRSLDLSPKEYAYIKGALLFNPDVPGLQVPEFIEGLQQEAHRVLQEVVVTLHPQDQGRLTRILLTASFLQTIPQSLISELFFRPVVGQADLFQLMTEILLSHGAVPRDSVAAANESKWAKQHCQR